MAYIIFTDLAAKTSYQESLAGFLYFYVILGIIGSS
jgi:hypothetical protein